jgi:hypothetical protein
MQAGELSHFAASHERAARLVARASAALELAPRPSRDTVRAARRLYLEALSAMQAEGCVGPGVEYLPLRRLAQRVERLLWRARYAALIRGCRRCFGRLAVGLVTAAILIAAGLLWAGWFRADLLAHRPFVTSSDWAKCEPARGICRGYATAIFFHTNEELRPFIQYDLGRVRAVRRVEIINRRDSGLEDRAVPLVIQTSLDGSTWHELARRDYWFDVWRPDFPSTQTRYLKLMVDRRSILHLEGVRAWE